MAASVSAYAVSRARFTDGKILQRLLQKLDSRHPRHPLVDKKERRRLIAKLELLDQFERGRAGVGPHDAKSLAVLSPQIPLDRTEDIHVVIDSQNHWLLHTCYGPARST